MSRIGNKEIVIPAGVTVSLNNNLIEVLGALGSLSHFVPQGIDVKILNEKVQVLRVNDSKPIKSKHGLTRTLIQNMITGVSVGFKKGLIINGVGYKAIKQGNKLVLNIGFSHPVEFVESDGITFEVPSVTEITVKGIDKEKVGLIAANIRIVKPVEPYHNYGIRYSTEVPRHKEGKTGKK